MAATKKKPTRASAKPRARARRSSAHKPVLEQRQLDLIGLGLVALGIFLAFLLWGDWQGGRAGEALVRAGLWASGEEAGPTPDMRDRGNQAQEREHPEPR
jgi:DNA segregation ATPase FtsK/SpoIIIE, S-DNA-T family